jgi:hypothetical protein
LSVAVALPVLAGSCESWQFSVILAGHVSIGFVISCTEITCKQVLKLPQLSFAFQVLLMVYLPGQIPGIVKSVKVITGARSQLSVAVAVPVLSGNCESWQLMVMLLGQVITGIVMS